MTRCQQNQKADLRMKIGKMRLKQPAAAFNRSLLVNLDYSLGLFDASDFVAAVEGFRIRAFTEIQRKILSLLGRL